MVDPKYSIDNYVKWITSREDFVKELKRVALDVLLYGTYKEETTMSFNSNKPYSVSTSYWDRDHFSSLESAIEKARESSISERKDVPIYKAVQVVKFPIPEAADLKTEKVA